MLEADVEGSAARISAQLPSIASAINSKSTIKVGVELDQGMVQAQAQTIGRTIKKAVTAHKVGVRVDVDEATINRVRRVLSSMKLDASLTNNFEQALRSAGLQVDKVSTEFEQVGDNVQKVTQAMVKAKNAAGDLVDYAVRYNKATGELDIKTVRVTQDLEKQRIEQERLAQAQKKAQDANTAYISKQRQDLQKIQDIYTGRTSAKPITDGLNLGALNAHFNSIIAELARMESQTDELSASQKAWVNEQIAKLNQMVKAYQNVEYAATQLRTKSVTQIRGEQTSNLDKYEEELRSAGLLTEEFKARIASLRNELSGSFDLIQEHARA